MKLIELTAKNFMPYFGDLEIRFPQDRDRNVLVVLGDNMRGKTSLLNAVRWSFYGVALGRHSREIALKDLVNREAASQGDWTVESCIKFEAGGHQYELRRRASKRAYVSVPTRSQDFEVSRALKRDDIVISDHLVDMELNRLAPEQTSRFFLFDGELLQEYESLLMEGSEQGRRIKEAIEQALGVPTLIRGREDARTLLKAAQKQQNSEIAKVAGLERQAARQAELQAKIAAREADIEKLKQRLKETRTQRDDLDDFINGTDAVHQAKVRLTAKEGLLENALRRQRELEDQRLLLLRDAWRDVLRPHLSLKREHLQQQYSQINEKFAARSNLQARVEQLKASVEEAICASCGQPVNEEQRIRNSQELGRLEAQLAGAFLDMDRFLSFSAQMKDLDKLLRPGPSESLLHVQRELVKLSVEQTQLENEIESLRDQVRGHDTADIARKRAHRDGLIREEGRLESSMDEATSLLDKDNRELQMLSRALEGNPQARTARSSAMVRLADELERSFSASISRLREDLKVQVEHLATVAFKQLTTQSKYSRLKINDNYGLAIVDELGQEVSLRSAGAEQIVALALIDGLARAGRSPGPVIMDTPFGRLDPKHRLNIMRYLPANHEQIVLLVHEGEFSMASDMPAIGSRIGSVYEIKEVNPRHSRLERVVQ